MAQGVAQLAVESLQVLSLDQESAAPRPEVARRMSNLPRKGSGAPTGGQPLATAQISKPKPVRGPDREAPDAATIPAEIPGSDGPETD